MIRINTKSTVIPVNIGDLEFFFDLSDESIERTHKKHEVFVANFNKVSEGNEESIKLLLDEGFSLFLGPGAFDKIYKQTPSTVICIEYLWSLSESLYEEMKKVAPRVSQVELAKEYLNKKNSK